MIEPTNAHVQGFFRQWHAIDNREAEDAYIPLIPFPAVAFRRLELERPLDADGMKALLAENVRRMEGMAVAMFHKACEHLPAPADLQGDGAVNPYAIGLDPKRWQEDGLFEGPGLTLAEAYERAEGIRTIWLDELVAGVPASGPPTRPS